MDNEIDETRSYFQSKFKNEDFGKPLIFILGKTGVGKSTLVNAMFGEALAVTGVGDAITKNIDLYERDDFPLVLADSRGLEGEEYSSISSQLKDFVSKRSSTGDPKDAVNVAWYCVNSRGNRLESGEIKLIKAIHEFGIPIIVVLTQGQHFDEKTGLMLPTFKDGSPTEEWELAEYTKSQVGEDVDCIILVRAKSSTLEYEGQEIKIEKMGLEQLAYFTAQLLPKGEQSAFNNALEVQSAKAQRISNEVKAIINKVNEDSPGIAEGLSSLIGGAAGSGASLAGLSALGTSGLSAAGITSGLSAAGGLIGGGMISGIGVLAAPVALLAVGGWALASAVKKSEAREALDEGISKLKSLNDQIQAMSDCKAFIMQSNAIDNAVSFLQAKKDKL